MPNLINLKNNNSYLKNLTNQSSLITIITKLSISMINKIITLAYKHKILNIYNKKLRKSSKHRISPKNLSIILQRRNN
jgi:hypothetical protein